MGFAGVRCMPPTSMRFGVTGPGHLRDVMAVLEYDGRVDSRTLVVQLRIDCLLDELLARGDEQSVEQL